MTEPDIETPKSTVGSSVRWGLLALAVVVVLVLIFQNTEIVTVKVLFWEFAMSRMILILLAVACGFVGGWVVARVSARRAGRR
jgi:uncharacterized integral membrane protein